MPVSTALALLLAVQSGVGAAPHRERAKHPAGLGQVLTTKDGGQIYGFDIDQNGEDGVLASAQDSQAGYRVSVETFDQNTGKIVKSFAKSDGPRDSYSLDGIFAGDVGLVTHYIVPDGQIYAKRKYAAMNPVAGNRFTGGWTPPVRDIDIHLVSHDQSSATSSVFAIALKKQDAPILLVSDIAANTFSNTVRLDPNLFGLCNGPQLGQFTAGNLAWIASSPDCGAVGGQPPVNALIDLTTGNVKTFSGYNNGFYHAGSVNGGAVDPNTGIAATTTELNSQVEFYNLKKKSGIAFTQLPCTTDTDQTNSGSAIAVDPVNRLFLVTDTNYCDGSQGSAIVIYDEKGNLVETITGFSFFIGEPAPAINPSKRMGWAFGGPNGWSQLQQFFY
jgi:hypothetical protein